MNDFSSDYILAQYQKLNELNWRGREPEEDEEDPNDLEGVLDGMPEEE